MRLCLCVCVYAYVHVSACIYNVYIVQGPEVAVLDWYGPEADPVYWWRRGGGGGGGWQDSR